MEEIPVIDRTVARDTPLPYDREFDDGKPITYNTGETSNLIAGDNYTTPRISGSRPEPIELFPGKGAPLGGSIGQGTLLGNTTLTYVPPADDFTNVTKDEINNALISSRSKRKMTAEGIANMANHLRKRDGNFYLVVKGSDDRIYYYKLTYKEQGNKIIKFYAYSRFNDEYGVDITQLIKLLFTDPIEFNEKYKNMSKAQFNQILQTAEVNSRRREQWEQWEQVNQMDPGQHSASMYRDQVHMDQSKYQDFSHPTPSKIHTLETIRQRQQIIVTPEFRKLIDKKVKTRTILK